MAVPSGYGSEILKSSSDNARTSGSFTAINLAVSGIWTATVLSIVVNNISTDEPAIINIDINNGSDDIRLIYNQSIPAYGSFVFSDRLVMEDGMQLILVRQSGTATWDTYVSYILQNWT